MSQINFKLVFRKISVKIFEVFLLFKSQKPNHIGVTSVNLPEVMKLVNDDEDYEMSLRLLLRAGDIMQHYTTAYFNQSKLYIMEVKVICRAGGDKWGNYFIRRRP